MISTLLEGGFSVEINKEILKGYIDIILVGRLEKKAILPQDITMATLFIDTL